MTALTGMFRITVEPDVDGSNNFDTVRTFYVLSNSHDLAARYGQQKWYDEIALRVTTTQVPFAEISGSEKGTVTTTIPHESKGQSVTRKMKNRE
jgi:hypothetical protein